MRIMDLEEFEQTKVNITDDVSELPDKVLVNIITGVRAQTSEYVYPATKDTVGGIKVGKGLVVSDDGTLDAEVTKKYVDDLVGKVPTKLSDLNNDEGFITDTVDNLVNYYNKNQIHELITKIPKFEVLVVDQLPDTDISPTTLYLLKDIDDGNSNMYAEYMYVGGSQPTPVPSDGSSVSKVYLNTALGIDQVVSVLANSDIRYEESSASKSYKIVSNTAGTKYVSIDIYTAYNIYGVGYTDTDNNLFVPYFFNDYNEKYGFRGWNPNLSDPVVLGFNKTLVTGQSNDSVSDIISMTPYKKGKWEILGTAKLDTSQFALKSELPTKLSDLKNDTDYITKEIADQTYAKIGETGSGGNTEIPVASVSVLGGIKTGYGNSQKGFYGVKVNEENRAYVMAPAVEFSPQNLTEGEKGVARDNIGALGREQAKDLYQAKGNYITENNLPLATTTRFGMVRPGDGLKMTDEGIIALATDKIEADSIQWKNIKNNPLTVTDVKVNV